jgi:hypothetical protein
VLYLQSLAAARRDDAFRKAIDTAAPAVRDDPEMLGTIAAHEWNVGDLRGAFRAIEASLTQEPDNPHARLLKIEILARQDRSSELLLELDKPVENLRWTRLQDRFRIAALLGHLGYVERAVSFAYRLFLEHRDNSQAWMTLSILVLEQGRGAVDAPRAWDVQVVAPNVAVDIRYDDGQEVFFVVEPDASLRQLDEESWEPEHPLVQTLLGSPNGARFADPTGREGTITQLRHKYVARLHYVMQRHQARFPTADGFRSVPNSIDIELREPTLAQETKPATQSPGAAGTAASSTCATVISLSWTTQAFPSVKGVLHQPAAKPTLKQETGDAILLAIAKARSWIDDLASGRIRTFAEIAEREGKVERHVRLLTPLAFIPPRTLAAIIDGTGRRETTVTALARSVPPQS